MSNAVILPDFDEPALARAVEALSEEGVNRLPFGAIRLDPQGAIFSTDFDSVIALRPTKAEPVGALN